MNKVDLAYPGSPLLSGDACSYMFHEEFNALLSTCRDSEGLLIGSQIRVIQSPIKQCSRVSQQYIPMLNIEDLARIYVKENTDSQVICCDYFESGFGYLFTNCGGN